MSKPAAIDRATVQAALATGSVEWRKHALQRMALRKISRAAVLEVLKEVDMIEAYAEARPYPSALFMGFQGTRPLHVLAALDEALPKLFIITVYEPDSEHFGADFRTRKKKA